MARHRSFLIAFVFLFLLALPTVAQIQTSSTSADANAKIRDEGIAHSQVMKTTSYLTDVSGPRLTNSPGIRNAAQWVLGKMNEWGIANSRIEPWGPFGRGWSNDHFEAAMVKPYHLNIIGSPKAWTPGTNGVVTGDV
ncbi:MAG TPA: peptidase M28, partial [Terriglobia bacterium]|nr:peptidase M28 [Terriglobia bacterium]